MGGGIAAIGCHGAAARHGHDATPLVPSQSRLSQMTLNSCANISTLE